MRSLRTLANLRRAMIGSIAALAAIPCLAQTAGSAGAVTPNDAAAGGLAQTNIWVLAVLFLAIAAIVVALIFRKKPATSTV